MDPSATVIPHQTLLTPKEAAEFLGLTPRFLEMRRYRGDGPLFIRISGRVIRYRREDLETWVGERVRSSTADPGHEQDR